MLSALIDACFRQRWLVMALLAGVIVLGIYVAFTLPVDAFPDLTNNQVSVITEAGPMSPTEVESQVTYPIETALMGVPRSVELRSISKLGLSLVTIVFDDRVDLYFARQLVNERLREVRGRLPQGLEPTLGPVATAFGELYQYTIDNPKATLLDRKTLQDWVVRPQLRTVPGIGEVNAWGGLTRADYGGSGPGGAAALSTDGARGGGAVAGGQHEFWRRLCESECRAIHGVGDGPLPQPGRYWAGGAERTQWRAGAGAGRGADQH